MDTADEFGSLFDEIEVDTSRTAVEQRQVLAEWGEDPTYNWGNPYAFAGPNNPHPGLGHTMRPGWDPVGYDTPAEDISDVIDGENEEAALPVTYGDEDEADKVAARLATALVGQQHTAGPTQCPKCGETFRSGDEIEMVAGVGLQHKGQCPQRRSAASSAVRRQETPEERGKRLLAYVDASLRGETPEGPNPFDHLDAGQADNEISSYAANYLATKGQGIQSTALKQYSVTERQAIIDEGEEERAGNLDRLDISGTHYEALAATASRVPEDEDLTFLDGDPNLSD